MSLLKSPSYLLAGSGSPPGCSTEPRSFQAGGIYVSDPNRQPGPWMCLRIDRSALSARQRADAATDQSDFEKLWFCCGSATISGRLMTRRLSMRGELGVVGRMIGGWRNQQPAGWSMTPRYERVEAALGTFACHPAQPGISVTRPKWRGFVMDAEQHGVALSRALREPMGSDVAWRPGPARTFQLYDLPRQITVVSLCRSVVHHAW